MSITEKGFLYRGSNLKFIKRITAFSTNEKFLGLLKRAETVSDALYGIHRIDITSNKPQK